MMDRQLGFRGGRRSNFDTNLYHQGASSDPWQVCPSNLGSDARPRQFRRSLEMKKNKGQAGLSTNKKFATIAFSIVAGTIILTEAHQNLFGDPDEPSIIKYGCFGREELLLGADDKTAKVFQCFMGFTVAAACLKAYCRMKAVEQRPKHQETSETLVGNGSPMQLGIVMGAIVLTGLITITSGSLFQEVKVTPTSRRRDFVNNVIGWSTWPPTALVCMGIMGVALRQAIQKKKLIEETPAPRAPFRTWLVLAVSAVGWMVHHIKSLLVEANVEQVKTAGQTYIQQPSSQPIQKQPRQMPFLILYALVFFAFGLSCKWLRQQVNLVMKSLSEINLMCNKEISGQEATPEKDKLGEEPAFAPEKCEEKIMVSSNGNTSCSSDGKLSANVYQAEKTPLKAEISPAEEDNFSESYSSSVAATKELFENVIRRAPCVASRVEDVAVSAIYNNLGLLEDFERVEKIVEASQDLEVQEESGVLDAEEQIVVQAPPRKQHRHDSKRTRIPVLQKEPSQTSFGIPKKSTGPE